MTTGRGTNRLRATLRDIGGLSWSCSCIILHGCSFEDDMRSWSAFSIPGRKEHSILKISPVDCSPFSGKKYEENPYGISQLSTKMVPVCLAVVLQTASLSSILNICYYFHLWIWWNHCLLDVIPGDPSLQMFLSYRWEQLQFPLVPCVCSAFLHWSNVSYHLVSLFCHMGLVVIILHCVVHLCFPCVSCQAWIMCFVHY